MNLEPSVAPNWISAEQFGVAVHETCLKSGTASTTYEMLRRAGLGWPHTVKRNGEVVWSSEAFKDWCEHWRLVVWSMDAPQSAFGKVFFRLR